MKKFFLSMDEQVVLVDEKDRPLGYAGKMESHVRGLLHRAVSVFIFNSRGELLLQKRATSKYHCGGLWSNTCCGHPLPGESAVVAAERRLKDEMRMNIKLTFINAFIYKAQLANGLIEHEYDHVFYGMSDDVPDINPFEADDWKYINPAILKSELIEKPEIYTPWLKICIESNILGKLI
jgi:isopentenyl-diphosphate delta-isomerase